MAKRKWAILFKSGRRKNYYRMMSGIGPAFGPKESAIIYPTKWQAQYDIDRFPVIASVMCKPVRID